jgi:competence protein ComEA
LVDVTAPGYVAPLSTTGTGPAAPSATITVHVTGAVARPGLVTVPAGARVAEAIAAAGGSLRTADLSAINLAAPMSDAEQVHVPVAGEGRSASAVPSPVGETGVQINVAGVEELETLPGVGPVLAARIVEFRDVHGPFAVVEDLLDVPGIGEGKLAELRDAVLLP